MPGPSQQHAPQGQGSFLSASPPPGVETPGFTPLPLRGRTLSNSAHSYVLQETSSDHSRTGDIDHGDIESRTSRTRARAAA